MTTSSRPDLIRNMLAIFLVGGMIATCFWVLRPFIPAFVWATMIVVATWPLLLAIEERFGGKRYPAVATMIGILVLVFVVPFALAVGTIVDSTPQIAAWGKQLQQVHIPAPSEWVGYVPLVGEELTAAWKKLAGTPPAELASRFSPYLRDLARWIVTQAGSLGRMLVHILLTLLFSGLLYLNGEKLAQVVSALAMRIAGQRGIAAAQLAANAVRAVAMGVVVTALIQSVLAGIGLAVVGIPYAALLTAVIFMLTVAQIGGGPVLIPAVIWLYWQGSTGWGTALLVWAVLVMSMDAFLRPALIRRNANLPLLLIFAGVIGGLLAFGIIGMFIGPVLLAVSYTLLTLWVSELPETEDA